MGMKRFRGDSRLGFSKDKRITYKKEKELLEASSLKRITQVGGFTQ